MYNGIGLQTPRGSGTSGHIQTNVSLNFRKPQNRQAFLKELQEKRKVNFAPARKANPDIVEHERKREIVIQTMKLRAKLEEEGVQAAQIDQKIKKAKEILKKKYERGELASKNKDTHVVSQAKEKEYLKLSDAFGLNSKFKQGSAFDFTGFKEERLKKLEDKRKKAPQFQCPHNQCGKVYDVEERLQRHLKYKHPKQITEKEQ